MKNSTGQRLIDFEQIKLMNEILSVTIRIKNEFPVLYKNLIETPLFLSYSKKEISTEDFKKYLESLKEQLGDFQNSH